MPTLVRDPQPADFEALLERRRRLGQDLFDEVWEGVLHMNPAPHSQHGRLEWDLAGIVAPLAADAGLRALGQFNLGEEGDYRVPDGALVRPGPDAVYLPTAALVLEILSPGDETWEKLDFYAAHGVEELVIVDPKERVVSWLGLETGEYKHLKRSRLIDLGAAELASRIDWPQDDCEELRVNLGDVLEIAGRLQDVVPDKQGGARLEPAITMTAAEILAAHGERALIGEEFEAYFGDLPSDGEGQPLLEPKGLAASPASVPGPRHANTRSPGASE